MDGTTVAFGAVETGLGAVETGNRKEINGGSL